MSFMGKILSGQAPLRGRASLELVVHTLDYRLAAQFWGITDPRLATLVHSIVGGSPAYRRDLIDHDVPRDINDFDDWVTRTVLSPTVPLFREARYLLSEELEVRDPALYLSVLGAVVAGNTTRGAIASYVQRSSGDITHPIQVLEDAWLLRRDQDPFRQNKTTYRITEPLLVFYHAVMRPSWNQFEQHSFTNRVWHTRRRIFECQVLGPHFEQISRDWTFRFSPPDMFDDFVARVGHGTVNDPRNRTTHEVDVVALGPADNNRPPLLAIGEAKWNDEMGRAHLERLEHIRNLIAQAGKFDVTNTRLICFSGKGFNEHLRHRAAERPDVLLVGLDELYGFGD